MYENIDAA